MIHPLFDITGKKAIVTGGTRGLGRGAAEGLLEAGCEVAIIGSSDGVMRTAEEYRAKGYVCHGVKADLRNRDEVFSSFAECMDTLGGDLDILVTAAGIQRRHPCEEFPLEEWDEVLRINLDAVFIQCQLAGRIMLAKGYGKIVNVTSMAIHFGGILAPPYVAAKAGVSQISRTMANEWLSRGVNVNTIAPGYMATDMCQALVDDPVRSKQITERIPAGRWGKGEDLKGTVIYLSSHASDYLGGAIIPVDGGYLSK